MSQLRILPSVKQKAKPDYGKIYQRIFMEKLTLAADNLNKGLQKQLVYFGVKTTHHFGKNFFINGIPPEERLLLFHGQISFIDSQIGKLTPSEFITTFPIKKTYDGSRWETKDYFTTMSELHKIGMDNPIGENVLTLLWDYQNWNITRYLLMKMEVLSALRQHQGQKSIMTEFLEDQGITPLRMMTNEATGQKFLYDSANHTTIPVSEKKPRRSKWIKAI